MADRLNLLLVEREKSVEWLNRMIKKTFIMNILSKIYNRLCLYRKQRDEHKKYKRKINEIKKRIGLVTSFSEATIVDDNSVVVIEPNPFHGETVPGYVKYFLDLGYHVDVFLTYEIAFEQPFNRMDDNFRVFVGEYTDIQRWITYGNMKRYVVVFFSTLFYYVGHKFLPSTVPAECKDRVFGIVHNLELYKLWINDNSTYYEMLHDKRFASLSKIEGLYHVNPNYFGKIKNGPKNTKKIGFVAVGAISYKNYDILLDAVRGLVVAGLTSFEVHIIGSGTLQIPQDLMPYIKCCGRLSFPSMYDVIECSDFLLALLDPNDKSHQIYLHGTTSGSLQLSLGFVKPLVINTLFAEAYTLDCESAVTYEDNTLLDAMQQAMFMSTEQYTSIQYAIVRKRDQIRKESLEEIEIMMTRICDKS